MWSKDSIVDNEKKAKTRQNIANNYVRERAAKHVQQCKQNDQEQEQEASRIECDVDVDVDVDVQ